MIGCVAGILSTASESQQHWPASCILASLRSPNVITALRSANTFGTCKLWLPLREKSGELQCFWDVSTSKHTCPLEISAELSEWKVHLLSFASIASWSLWENCVCKLACEKAILSRLILVEQTDLQEVMTKDGPLSSCHPLQHSVCDQVIQGSDRVQRSTSGNCSDIITIPSVYEISKWTCLKVVFMTGKTWIHLKADSMVKVCPGLKLGLNTAQGTDRNSGSRSKNSYSLPARNLWRTADSDSSEPKTWRFFQWDLQRWYKIDSLRASTGGKMTVRRKNDVISVQRLLKLLRSTSCSWTANPTVILANQCLLKSSSTENPARERLIL